MMTSITNIDELMSMEHWWNDTDTEKPTYSEKNLSQCHLVHHKAHVGWTGTEPVPPTTGQQLTAPAMAWMNYRSKQSQKCMWFHNTNF
jgi:hypothetical protein